MKVKAKWHHVIAVEREVEVDEESFNYWMHRRYGEGADRDLALTVWIENLDSEDIGEIFHDWRTSDPLPSDFELQYSEVIDARVDPESPER